jgi:acetyl esterase/lipase
MKPIASLVIGVLCVLSCFTVSVRASEPETTLNIWPGKVPGETAAIGPERLRISVPPATPQKEVFDVSTPAIEIYRPSGSTNTGAAMIVLPGGGFSVLKMDYEGEDCAVWLNSIGVTGIVLKYRVPQRQGAPSRYWPALQDTQRAISFVRSRAAEWNVDPNRIGIVGFSAGSVVGAVAENNFEKRSYESVDDVDKISCRPDFAALVYPGALVQDGKLIPEIQVSKESPPTFIAIANNDNTESSVALYSSLKKAGVSAELHIYADGAHGFGMRPSTQPHATWPNRLQDWMNNQGLLKPPHP